MSNKKQEAPTKTISTPITDLQVVPTIKSEEWVKMLSSSLKSIADIQYQSQEAFRRMLGPYMESLKYINETIKSMTEFPRLKYIEQIEATNKLVSEALNPMFEEVKKNQELTDNKNVTTLEPTIPIETPQPLPLQIPDSTAPVYVMTQDDFDRFKKEISIEVFTMLRTKKKDDKITIFLTSSGTFYRNVENKEIQYNAYSSKKPLEVFRFLNAQEYNFVETPIITKHTSCLNDSAVRKAVNKFNEAANFRLKLVYDIIDSKQGSGYRINPKYRIKIVD